MRQAEDGIRSRMREAAKDNHGKKKRAKEKEKVGNRIPRLDAS